MKKLMLILLIAVTTLGTAYGQTSIAHVNTQKVLDTMPSRINAMKELENFERRAVKELQETQQKLQADYAKLQQEQKTMSPTAFKFEEERLMKKSQEFQTRQQELDQQIQILSQELNAPILETVQTAVAKVCKQEKISYVIDESSLLYSGGRDITDLVVKEVLLLEKAKETANAPKENN
ncbi:MAG TPA: OmpH family outer membrane protein [Brumimicrobium sp.]|nr:OmpH family outer membrane protein [Brumimicrobium sp.]